MNRHTILQALIDKFGYKSYLEIGTRRNWTFDKINIDKVGVDPDPKSNATYCMTSDEFFKFNLSPPHDIIKTFDLIFIDGLHHADQFMLDVLNSLDILNKGGTIVCHDCNPTTEEKQNLPFIPGTPWNGDVWKGWVTLRDTCYYEEMFVVDCDEGIGIIQDATKLSDSIFIDLTYQQLEQNRTALLNLKTPEYFTEWIQQK